MFANAIFSPKSQEHKRLSSEFRNTPVTKHFPCTENNELDDKMTASKQNTNNWRYQEAYETYVVASGPESGTGSDLLSDSLTLSLRYVRQFYTSAPRSHAQQILFFFNVFLLQKT